MRGVKDVVVMEQDVFILVAKEIDFSKVTTADIRY